MDHPVAILSAISPSPLPPISIQGPCAADTLPASPLLTIEEEWATDAVSKPLPPISIEGPCAADTQPAPPPLTIEEALATDAMGKPITGRWRVPGIRAGIPYDPVPRMATQKQPLPEQHPQPQPMAMQRQPPPEQQPPPQPERSADGLSIEDKDLSICIGKFSKSKVREHGRDPWVTINWLLERDKFRESNLDYHRLWRIVMESRVGGDLHFQYQWNSTKKLYQITLNRDLLNTIYEAQQAVPMDARLRRQAKSDRYR